MDFEGYCVKCKKKVKVSNAQVVEKTVKGKKRRFMTGKCPNCGTAVWRVMPNN